MNFLIWGSLAIIFLIIELIIPTLVSIWLSLSALIVVFLSYYITDIKILTLIFIIISILFIFITKPLINKISKNKEKYSSDMSGQIVEIYSKKNATTYEVRYKGILWDAISETELNVGDKAVIKELKGNKIYIEKE